jgi:hypothetical protein
MQDTHFFHDVTYNAFYTKFHSDEEPSQEVNHLVHTRKTTNKTT